MGDSGSRQVSCHWPDIANEHGAPMLWLGTWLVGARGEEGDWFHSGRGAAVSQHRVPPDATGLRIRRWISEGLAPEYVDLIPVPRGAILVQELPFERPQVFSLLAPRSEPVERSRQGAPLPVQSIEEIIDGHDPQESQRLA